MTAYDSNRRVATPTIGLRLPGRGDEQWQELHLGLMVDDGTWTVCWYGIYEDSVVYHRYHRVPSTHAIYRLIRSVGEYTVLDSYQRPASRWRNRKPICM